MSQPPVIDLEAIKALAELNPDDNGEFLKEIIMIFLEDTPQRIAELEESLKTGDTSRFVRAAHSIKGSSANMGTMVLRRTAEQLEQHAKHSGLADTEELLGRLRTDYAEAAAAIAKLMPA
jgi:HPt (histidine-containing phosphotransfer) domain-containing protein